MFSLFFLHLFAYGCNIFMWRKTRINYTFIFEFAPTKELKYRDVFLICTTSMTIIVGVMFAHLTLIVKGYSSSAVQAIPGCLLLVCYIEQCKCNLYCSLLLYPYEVYASVIQVFLLILVCPFKILYRSSRYHFLRAIRNIILTPFYKVFPIAEDRFYQMSRWSPIKLHTGKQISKFMFICRLSWSISSWLISFVVR
jgi:hypothetical protein